MAQPSTKLLAILIAAAADRIGAAFEHTAADCVEQRLAFRDAVRRPGDHDAGLTRCDHLRPSQHRRGDHDLPGAGVRSVERLRTRDTVRAGADVNAAFRQRLQKPALLLGDVLQRVVVGEHREHRIAVARGFRDRADDLGAGIGKCL